LIFEKDILSKAITINRFPDSTLGISYLL